MIMINDKDLYVNCSCGTKFVAMEGDFKINPFTQQIYANCPICDETYYVLFTDLDIVKPEIKGEKCEDN